MTDDRTYERKEAESGFTPILIRLLQATPGAVAAALVDGLGEAVDYAGDTIDPFEIKVAAAHFRIILQHIEQSALTARAGMPQRIIVESDDRSYILDSLPDGYALLSLVNCGADTEATHAIDGALRDLYLEAGWQAPPGAFRWYEVEIRLGSDNRPNAIKTGRNAWTMLSMIGRVAVGFVAGELAYRVSFGGRAIELTLVKARDDRWYADVPPDQVGEG